MKKEDENRKDQEKTETPDELEKESRSRDEELELKLQEANDKYLRLYSEFDNYRKRTSKEKVDLVKYADEDILKTLLPIVDDFERALLSVKKEQGTLDSNGIQLIYNKMAGLMEKKGLQPILAKGAKFDEDFHEAITQIPASEEQGKGFVVDEIEKGYMLNDKVIRFAKVVVSI